MTPSDSSASICVDHRARFALDGGNRNIKFFDAAGQPQILRSCVKRIETWEDVAPADGSVVIRAGGECWVVGDEAKAQEGVDTFASREGKAERAKILLMAALDLKPECDSLLIDTLAIASPDSRELAARKPLQALVGSHCFERNGRHIEALIKQVVIVDEGLAAWRYAWTHDGFEYACNNGVLDLGGGTAIARIITPNGIPVRGSDIKLKGTKDLAQRIAAALQAKEKIQPDLGEIMDAIADQTYKAGVHGIPFQAIFERQRQQWLDEIAGDIQAQWEAQLNSLGEVLVVGGSAPLAQAFVEMTHGRFKIPRTPDPQLFNLYGLLEEG